MEGLEVEAGEVAVHSVERSNCRVAGMAERAGLAGRAWARAGGARATATAAVQAAARRRARVEWR